MKRMIAALVGLALAASGCSFLGGGDEAASSRTLSIEFSRAVQTFPGNSVRILGVTVGRVTDVETDADAARVTIRIDDPDIKLPADVQATLVPVSLLGERYVQLFPAYEGGPTFDADVLGMDSTSVPAEQDELLQGLQDYFGAIDPEKVGDFVTNAAIILEGNGEGLNQLIDKGSDLVSILAAKRDSLAGLVHELNTLTLTLSTRQKAIARVINSYNTVGRTINDNRVALEGTIEGLNLAATELAALLTENRNPLGSDVRSLTRSLRTLSRNAETFARTGKWAKRLFSAARRAVDYEQDWLRLGNQGEPLFEILMYRLEDRLLGVCLRLELDQCSNQRYWQEHLPNLFCNEDGSCDPGDALTPGQALDRALKDLPTKFKDEVGEEFDLNKKCKKAKHPKRCRMKKERTSEGEGLDALLDGILGEVNDAAESFPGTEDAR
ncbi:MAG: MCE family protein [Actinobacteria bacterium]|nr:MCE family protein [Actinomycetota bacterium]